MLPPEGLQLTGWETVYYYYYNALSEHCFTLVIFPYILWFPILGFYGFLCVRVPLPVHVLLMHFLDSFLSICLFCSILVCLFCLFVFKREKESIKLKVWEGGKDLGGHEGMETVIRIHHKKIFSVKIKY